MKHTGLFLLFGLALGALAPQPAETVAWRSGRWFDGTRTISTSR
jgi:hypothetical protein